MAFWSDTKSTCLCPCISAHKACVLHSENFAKKSKTYLGYIHVYACMKTNTRIKIRLYLRCFRSWRGHARLILVWRPQEWCCDDCIQEACVLCQHHYVACSLKFRKHVYMPALMRQSACIYSCTSKKLACSFITVLLRIHVCVISTRMYMHDMYTHTHTHTHEHNTHMRVLEWVYTHTWMYRHSQMNIGTAQYPKNSSFRVNPKEKMR